MIKTVILILLILFIAYVLYINGYGSFSNKSALMYIGSMPENNKCKAKFVSCTGTVKRVVKFKENKDYQFCLKPNLSQGSFTVELQNKEKQTLIALSESKPIAKIEVYSKQRYYLVFRYKSATGDYMLNWE